MIFKIGDRVTNRKLGPITIGEIVGIIPADFYLGEITWLEQYPDWRSGSICYIKLDKDICGIEYFVFPEEDLILLGDLNNDDSLP